MLSLSQEYKLLDILLDWVFFFDFLALVLLFRILHSTFLLELSVLLGKLGRQVGFLPVSMPSSRWSSSVGCQHRRPASSDVALAAVRRHFATEGRAAIS